MNKTMNENEMIDFIQGMVDTPAYKDLEVRTMWEIFCDEFGLDYDEDSPEAKIFDSVMRDNGLDELAE